MAMGSVTRKLNRNYMFYSNAHEIREDLSNTYFMQQDISMHYELESKIFDGKQDTLFIAKYYGKLKLNI